MFGLHRDLTGVNLHEAFHYVDPADPGAVGAGKYWLDTSAEPYVLKRRNGTDDGWITIGGGEGGEGATVFTDLTDVPEDYIGDGGKVVAVKTDETGLEFLELPSGGGSLSPIGVWKLAIDEEFEFPSLTNVIIPFDTFDGDLIADFDLVEDTKITTTEASEGNYLASGFVITTNPSTDASNVLLILKNGSTVARAVMPAQPTTDPNTIMTSQVYIHLVDGDYLELQFMNGSGEPTFVSGQPYCYLLLQKVL